MPLKQSFLKIKPSHLIKHETKRNILLKFSLVLLIFISYFIFIAKKYGVQQGLFVSTLSWSFFVLCTPIADAGFLLDFPIRLITKIKMLTSEMFIWTIAISLNLYAFFINPEIYNKTKLLSFFKHILEQPIPFWSIIILSAIGTFISIKFGDELLDKTKHIERKHYHKYKKKFKLIIMLFLIVITIVIYDFLLKKLGVALPL
jgi:hypothetical protein